jgi:hypothetical protein
MLPANHICIAAVAAEVVPGLRRHFLLPFGDGTAD